MGWFDFLSRLFGGAATPPPRPATPSRTPPPATPADAPSRVRRPRTKARLAPLRYRGALDAERFTLKDMTVSESPYAFARISVLGGYLDLRRGENLGRLEKFGLPVLFTPADVARWLNMSVGRLAWLTHRCEEWGRPADVRSSHYHYEWLRKKRGGYRLIEAPKPLLRAAQDQILEEILNRVPAHAAAHGFVAGRSIRTNAAPHVGQAVLLKLDLRNFYPTVTYARVVAIFRGLGYNREVAIWLAALTTSSLPSRVDVPTDARSSASTYFPRHLPQGAPTSPALANLSAFALDLRLAGLSRRFRAKYTRYADDLTFSGGDRLVSALRIFLPLVRKIISNERFQVHPDKTKVMRRNMQQRVTGVVVNVHPNIPRREFDALKAILHNCLCRGASTQNHDQRPDFAAHLRGRIAHFQSLNPTRGQKLLDLYHQIDWQS